MIGQAQQPELSWGAIAGIVLGAIFVIAITVPVAWGAWSGRDLPFFESYRQRDLRTFRRMVLTQRINGIIAIGICLFCLLISPFTEMRLPGMLLLAPIPIVWLWVLIRWTSWSWKTELPPK